MSIVNGLIGCFFNTLIKRDKDKSDVNRGLEIVRDGLQAVYSTFKEKLVDPLQEKLGDPEKFREAARKEMAKILLPEQGNNSFQLLTLDLDTSFSAPLHALQTLVGQGLEAYQKQNSDQGDKYKYSMSNDRLTIDFVNLGWSFKLHLGDDLEDSYIVITKKRDTETEPRVDELYTISYKDAKQHKAESETSPNYLALFEKWSSFVRSK